MSKNLPFSVHQHFVYLIQADSSGNYYGSLEVATIENGKRNMLMELCMATALNAIEDIADMLS